MKEIYFHEKFGITFGNLEAASTLRIENKNELFLVLCIVKENECPAYTILFIFFTFI